MYQVSEAYKVAVADSHRKSKMRGILTVGSTVINLSDDDILKDTVYITNQCTNGSEYEYGCVYSAECGITIKSAMDRYALYDAELKLFWSLWTGEAWEEIPLGVFYVSQPNRVNDKISIKALDGMTKLDVAVVEDTTGTMTELLPYIAEKCNVELAQTTEELSGFVNANVQYSVQADRIETYRDLLAYICQMSACFATFDRYGKLKLVQYATEPCVELGRKQRFTNATFSDYMTRYAGIKARFIAEENYAPYEVGDDKDGIVLDMGDNPIVRGLPETKKNILDAVYAVLKDVSYTPFEIETLGNPALDLGDYVKNSGVGKDGNIYLSPITYFYWTFRKKHKLRAVGGNPKIAGVNNKQGKQIGSLEADVESKSINVKSYVNADAITFKDEEVEIASLNFSATEKSNILFLMTVRLDLSLDGVLVIKFYTDAAEDKERVFRKYLERGEHFISLNEMYVVATNERHTVSIKACMEYMESDSRKQDADITTSKNFLKAIANVGATVADNVVQFPAYEQGVIDTTVAKANIEKGKVKAILYGQGISVGGKWDGTINLTEEIENFLFGSNFKSAVKEGNLAVKTQTPIGTGFAAVFSNVPFGGGIGIGGITETVVFGRIINDYRFNTEKADLYEFDKYVSTAGGMYSLKQQYRYDSVEEEIDEGKMCSVAIDYTGLDVESVVIEC